MERGVTGEASDAVKLDTDKAQFLCELVSARNIGSEAIEINAFYFREYVPFAADKLKLKIASVLNLWGKGPA